MDTKWNNVKKDKLLTGAAAIFCLIAGALIIVGIMIRRYYPLLSAAFALGAGYLLVRFSQWDLRRLDDKCEREEGLVRFQRLVNGQKSALAGMIIYFLGMLAVLLCPLGRYHHGILFELAYRRMDWIVAALLLEPTLCFGMSVYRGCSRRVTALITGLVDQNRSREELMAELEAEMRIAVEERIKSERMKIDLITNVSHDLKTPLTSVIGYIELMKKEEQSGVMRDYLEVLTRKTDILKNMIDNVFELARVSSGSAKPEPEVLDVNRLVRQVLADWDDRIREKKKIIKTEFAEGGTGIFADSTYLYRIVQNLVENAVKYSLDGTRVFVRTYVREGRVLLELINVSNYPIDLDGEAMKERFVRGDVSRSTEGNGLGLAIVETFVSALGGSFDIVLEGDTFKAVVSFALAAERADDSV